MAYRNVSSTFTFVEENGDERHFRPSENSGKIRAIATSLRERFPQGASVGLIYQSSPELITAWFACVLAGLTPLILQYPTRKQARDYWLNSVSNSIETARIAVIIADDRCVNVLGDSQSFCIVSQSDIDQMEDEQAGPIFPDKFAIIQLSSGTTGFRKAVRFSSEQLGRHVEDFNATLNLTSADSIVSWLPLYHDMGYIACFVMPLLLGLDVVMMDPMAWTRRPEMLFEAIERHHCTVCYMPNFGFEVMSRANARAVPSLRRWISCSEPVSAGAIRKFAAAIQASADTILPCYAMAENVFAVSLAESLITENINGVDVVSCGKAISNVELKVVGGQIWVKSPASIGAYFDGPDVRDGDGFYATGDLGELRNDQLFVVGRKQDLLIQAGRKFLLSDIDLRLNELFPEVRGRAAALALRDERIGTETPLLLIERPDFFACQDGPKIGAAVKDATGLDQLEVAFVPPRFLTKTSSGKFNRGKAVEHWLGVQSARDEGRRSVRDPVAELRASFQNVDWSKPVSDVLDSLSQTILSIVTEAVGLIPDGAMTLEEIEAKVRAASDTAVASPATAPEKRLRIVSLANKPTMARIAEKHLDEIEKKLGCKVTFEHLCLPPSPVLFSDIVFHDYFQPRLDGALFETVSKAINQLKEASLIIADDMAELAFLGESTYPVLSHNMERDPRADRICFRWQSYLRNHHRLPLSVVSGLDLPLTASASSLEALGRYLDVPIFRIAVVPGFDAYTQDWEFKALEHDIVGVEPDEFVERFVAWAAGRAERLKMSLAPVGPRMSVSDLPHFCAHMIKKDPVDAILQRFDTFCIAGQESSIPYIGAELERLGKTYVRVPSHAPQILEQVSADFDCLLLCGTWGDTQTEKPVIAIEHAGSGWRARNLGEFGNSLPELNEPTSSGTDWFYAFELSPLKDYKIWSQARVEMARRYADRFRVKGDEADTSGDPGSSALETAEA